VTNNGLQIKTWTNDKEDQELYNLMEWLKRISEEEEVSLRASK